MPRQQIPTEEQLDKDLKLVRIIVEGQYIARIDEERKTVRNYEVGVLVPKKFNKSDIKRLTPRVLRKQKDDFVSIRTFMQKGNKAEPSDKTMKRREMYSDAELARFERLRIKEEKELAQINAGRRQVGGAIDESEYDPNTGLPPLYNSGN